MEAAAGQTVGRTVLEAIEATRRAVDTNTNLGTVLLLAPLAKVPREQSLESGLAEVLAGLDAADARDVYGAILLAQPGGLGRVDRHDVADPPPEDLSAAMRAAADRDLVARQYADGFAEVLGLVVPWLGEGFDSDWSTAEAIVHVQMRLLARFPDSLIARKCGPEIAQEASARAAAVLDSGRPGDEAYSAALSDLDFWLRSDRHRRNPGTTADLIAAGLFVHLRDGLRCGRPRRGNRV
jgi:triphosphoribosyl-dephospho-CoA synthase